MEGSRMFFPAISDVWQAWATEHRDRKDQQGHVGSELHRLQSHRPGTHSLGSPQDKCPRPWCQSSDLEGVCGRLPPPCGLGARRGEQERWGLPTRGYRFDAAVGSPPGCQRWLSSSVSVRVTVAIVGCGLPCPRCYEAPCVPVRPVLCHPQVEMRLGHPGNMLQGGPSGKRSSRQMALLVAHCSGQQSLERSTRSVGNRTGLRKVSALKEK